MSKTVRQFQCRDDLWTRVDALAKRRGISTDDVIQHALMQLFKSKKKEGEASAITPVPGTTGPAAPRPAAAAPAPAAVPRPAAAAPAPTPTLPRPPGPPQPARPPLAASTPPLAASSPPASASSSGLGAAASSSAAKTMAPKLPRPATAPAAPAPAPAPAPIPAAPPSVAPGVGAVPKPAPSLPRPQPTAAPAATRLPPPAAKAAPQQVRPLYIMFEGAWYEVDKEEYVIGRGQKFSDLPIKDANISRRHCSIVRRGADYFIKDLGSTNGVEFEGTRVDNHKILEGSVYFLCDHELRFSFTPPSASS